MADNKNFESIMRKISDGLTGDAEKDMNYLKEQMPTEDIFTKKLKIWQQQSISGECLRSFRRMRK